MVLRRGGVPGQRLGVGRPGARQRRLLGQDGAATGVGGRAGSFAEGELQVLGECGLRPAGSQGQVPVEEEEGDGGAVDRQHLRARPRETVGQQLRPGEVGRAGGQRGLGVLEERHVVPVV